MKMTFAHFSRKGQKDANEDSVLPPFAFGGTWWAAVADGMGGRPGGAVASATVLETIAAKIKSGLSDLTELFAAARSQLQTVALKNPDLEAMGTTLSLIRFTESIAEVGHVGDSRIYHLRGETLRDVRRPSEQVRLSAPTRGYPSSTGW